MRLATGLVHTPRGLALALLGAGLLATPAAALTATDTLAADAAAARFLQVTCSDAGAGIPASLAVSVRDLAPVAAPTVSVQIRKGDAATSASDAVDGDASASPVVWLDGGPGLYDVYVDKTDAGEEGYEIAVQCWTGSGGTGTATGTSLSGLPSPVPAASLLGRMLLAGALAGVAGRRLAPGLDARRPRAGRTT
ncbi:MAG: hypothetical protein H6748_17945 [Spirochaetaceae bacterium]|nr:hypothetical protein [Spirochaetaceae bacterium]